MDVNLLILFLEGVLDINKEVEKDFKNKDFEKYSNKVKFKFNRISFSGMVYVSIEFYRISFFAYKQLNLIYYRSRKVVAYAPTFLL